MALLRARDAGIAALLDQGFEFNTNAFRPGQAPHGVPVRDCDQTAARLRREGHSSPMSVVPDVRVTS